LNGDVPSTAESFFPPESDGEMTERIAWGEPEYDTDKPNRGRSPNCPVLSRM